MVSSDDEFDNATMRKPAIREDWALAVPRAETDAPLGVPNYHRVRDAIRADIARGVLPCNARLKIGALSLRYGLSPAPIREALNQLEAEGWVIILPNRGASVRNIDETFLRDLNEIRIALESYFVRLAAEVATPEDVDRLEEIQKEYDAAVLRHEVPALIHLNARFHRTIAGLRPNMEATAIIQRHSRFFNTMRAEWGYQPHRPQEIAREHRALLDAFRRNDGAEAERISREHLRHAMNDLLARWREGAPRSVEAKE
jgi:DNA-binding GntR family transcriptional regulator